MNASIEVTKQVFDKLFDTDKHWKRNSINETYVKSYYCNSGINQRALRIHNRISDVWQYYLIDINA